MSHILDDIYNHKEFFLKNHMSNDDIKYFLNCRIDDLAFMKLGIE